MVLGTHAFERRNPRENPEPELFSNTVQGDGRFDQPRAVWEECRSEQQRKKSAGLGQQKLIV